MGALYSRRLRREAGKHAKWKSEWREYTEGQVEAAVTACGISISKRSRDDLLCYCPFHGNNHTPSFSIGLNNGLWLCYNPSCGARGSLESLLRRLAQVSGDELKLMLEQEELPDIAPLELEEQTVEYPEATLRRHIDALPGSAGETYLRERGFPVELCQAYDLGFDYGRDAVTMGVRQYDGTLVGEIFRRRKQKDYRNSGGFEKSKNLWNIHQARRKPEVVVCEGTLDSLAVIRAGYNAVSLLGGGGEGVSDEQAAMLNVYFTKMYIFTDDDAAGKQFGIGLAEHFAREVMFVPYGNVGKSDPGAMTDDEIKQCMDNALTEFDVLTA